MDSEKQVMSISSDEDEEVAQDHDSTQGGRGGAIKKSYDCRFCKRGFTNAQALGGHMNIHRNDRAKAKQIITNNNNSSSSLQITTNNIENHDEFMVLPFSSEFSSQFPTRNYSILESQRNNNNCDMYFHPPPNTYLPNQHASPYASYGFQHDEANHNLIRSHHRHVNFNEELGGANLSLQIGPTHDDVDNANNQPRKGNQMDDEVDLELRLGHDPS